MNQTDTSHEPLPPQNTPLVTLTFLHLLFVGVGVLVVANIVNYSLGTPFWLITQLIHLGSDNNTRPGTRPGSSQSVESSPLTVFGLPKPER